MEKRLLKILTFLLFTSTLAQAQTFEFRFQDSSVADDGMVTIPAVPDEYGFGELWCESNPSSNPNYGLILKLLSGTTATGSATLTIDHNTLNAKLLKWCMGGECVMMTDKTNLSKDFTVSTGSVQVQFDAENIQSEGYLLATLKVTIGDESHSVKIQFTNGETAGIKMTGFSNSQDARVYTIGGCQVDHPSGGIFIVNGKKRIIR